MRPYYCVQKLDLLLQSGTDVPRLLRLEIVVWKVPSLVGNAVAVSFVGLFVSHASDLTMLSGRDLVPEVGPHLPHRRQPRIQDSPSLAPYGYVTHIRNLRETSDR